MEVLDIEGIVAFAMSPSTSIPPISSSYFGTITGNDDGIFKVRTLC
jgi:hypothetical protein